MVGTVSDAGEDCEPPIAYHCSKKITIILIESIRVFMWLFKEHALFYHHVCID